MTAPCGAYAASQQHRKRGEALDAACLAAQRDYVLDYRQRRGPEDDRWWVRTRAAAMQRLADEYPRRFVELLADERSKARPRPKVPVR